MTARNWSLPASSGTGAEPRGSGPRRSGRGVLLDAEAGLRGGAAACGAAGRAAAGAQREVLRLSGVPLADRTSCAAASSLPCWGRKSVFSSTQPVPRARP